MPRVKIVATGGTIANTAQAGRMPIEQLLAEVPDVRRYAELETQEVIRSASSQFTMAEWSPIAQAVADAAAQPGIDGLVVTHGTVTSEETAYLLHLTVRTDKPVVVVCAQRRHGTPGNDGDRNLIDAVRVAASPQAQGKGVLLLMDEEIHCARDVVKSNQRPGGFSSPQGGLLGHVESDCVSFYRAPLRRHTSSSEFDVSQIAALPRVDIVAAYVGADGVPIRAVAEAGARGIVVNGFAFGGTPTADQTAALREAGEHGVAVVLVNRGGGGRVPGGSSPYGDRQRLPFVTGDNLSAQKARLLLMLALGKRSDTADLQRIFDSY
jgi:L-asparaginase